VNAQGPQQVRFLDRRTPPHIGTLVVMTALASLTLSIFLPSLPNMTRYFDTEYRLMQLSVSLFLAVNAGLQLVVGPLSDRFGRRPVLLAGVGLFLVATLGCIFAPTVEVFLAFRMTQAAVVVSMALSRAVVRDMYDQRQSASVIGYVTMAMSVVPMIGPAIGGLLDRTFGWQASFWLLFGAGLAVLVLIWADLGETAKSKGKPFLDQVREYPALLTSPRFWGYNIAATCSSGVFFAFLGGGPFVGSEVFGLDQSMLGLALGVPGIGYFAGNFLSGRYSVRFGINRMVLAGTLISATGLSMSLALFGLGLGSAVTFFGFMAFVGVGNGMVLPNAAAGTLSVRPSLAGTAAGLGGALMIAGGAGLSALAGPILTPESGATPLLWLMMLSSLGGVSSILFVMARTRSLGG